MSQGTTVTEAYMTAATEAVRDVVSIIKHGKVMFHFDGHVLENPSNHFKRTHG